MITTARRPLAVLTLLVACGLGSAGATRAAAAEERPEAAFALVVAHNQSLDPTVQPLRYADDDGARFYEWTSTFTRKTVLLAVLDTETQRTFPQLGAISRAPTRAQLQKAMGELAAEMTAAQKQGRRTVFYFYFAGHGDVGSDREGYINLVDGRFSRSDLYREVIGRSPADTNHVVIDACNSYFLINKRGVQSRKATPEEAIRSFLEGESLDRYPNTGVVLSTASAAESHEWSRYRSGIFSHQLLSALWGSADIDGDGRVEYRELAAYVAAANLRVHDGRARLSIFTRPPRLDGRAALVNLTRLRQARSGEARPAAGKVAGYLVLPRNFEGHYHLEDDRGVRYVDFNKTSEQPLRVALYDRPYYFLRSERAGQGRPGPVEARIVLEPAPANAQAQGQTQGDHDAGALAFAETPLASRGALEQSFRRDLYAFPFGQSFLAGHAAALDPQAGPQPVLAVEGGGPRPWFARARTWKWVTAGLAAGALVAGATLQGLAVQAAGELKGSPGHPISFDRATTLTERIDREKLGAAIGFTVAGAAAVSSLVLFLVDRNSPSPSAQGGTRLRIGASPHPTGGQLTLGGTFWSF